MGEFLKLLMDGDSVAWSVLAAMSVLVGRLIRDVVHSAQGHPEALESPTLYPRPLDMETIGQVAGIDWNDARTIGYLPMSQHVIMAEKELIGFDRAKPGSEETVEAVVRKCEYCRTMTYDSMRLACEKCGAPLLPTTPKPIGNARPTTPGWEVR